MPNQEPAVSTYGHGHFSKVSLATLLVALGIIYGDIGTSPLYVFKAILGERTISSAFGLWGHFLSLLDVYAANDL